MDRRRGRGQVSIGRAIVLRWAFLLFVGETSYEKKRCDSKNRSVRISWFLLCPLQTVLLGQCTSPFASYPRWLEASPVLSPGEDFNSLEASFGTEVEAVK